MEYIWFMTLEQAKWFIDYWCLSDNHHKAFPVRICTFFFNDKINKIRYFAIDNSSYECFTEEFDTLGEALNYLRGGVE